MHVYIEKNVSLLRMSRFSYKEPDIKVWLRNCTNLMKMMKTKGKIHLKLLL